MQETAVIYKSHYGSSRTYATWIAEATGAKLFERKDANLADLAGCDTIVYVGGLYASGIAGISWLRRNYAQLAGKEVIVVAVGAGTPTPQSRLGIMRKNYTTAMLEDKVRFYLLRGALDYPAMSTTHRMMMAAMIATVRRKAPGSRTRDDEELLNTYGGRVSFINRDAILPITLYIKNKHTGTKPPDGPNPPESPTPTL